MTVLLNVMLMLAACIGNTELWVIAVNRAYSLRIRHHLLRCFRVVMDLLILGYPFLLLRVTGIGSGSLIRGGSVSDLPLSAQSVLFLPYVGLLFWVVGVVRWHWVGKRQFRDVDQREVIDVVRAATASGRSGAEVRGRQNPVLRLWPWNEVFELEINHKTVWLPGSEAADRPLLRIVHLSDLHVVGCPGPAWYRTVVDSAVALSPDAFVFTGDLIDEPQLLAMAADMLSDLPRTAPSFFVLGNHDWRYEVPPIRSALRDTGWTDLGGASAIYELQGQRVLLAGTELPWLGNAPEVPDAARDLAILLSHSPDQVGFARRSAFDVVFCGHTHGGQVVLPIVGPVFAPSRHGVRYASGLFRESSLTMHVSRGVGAKAALRWKCRPELTCVTIRGAPPGSVPR